MFYNTKKFLLKTLLFFNFTPSKLMKNSSFCKKQIYVYSKTTECCELFDIKNIKIGFTYLEIWIYAIKPKKSVSFDLKRPDKSINLAYFIGLLNIHII